MAPEMMRLGPDRGSKIPVLPLLVVLLPIAAGVGTWRYIQVKSIRPLQASVRQIHKSLDKSETEQDGFSRDVTRMKREIDALQAIARVEILWGGEANPKDAKIEAKDTKIDFAFTHTGNLWVPPKDTGVTTWYYTDEHQTLGRIAAEPRVLGAYWLWPILAAENGLKVNGTEPLPAGQMIRIPARITEYQIRRAITEAGTPDKARDAIFAQAGLKP